MANVNLTKDIGNGEIVLYKPNDSESFEVRIDEDTVWLTQTQMVDLFQSTKQNISLHIRNIYKEGELLREALSRNT